MPTDRSLILTGPCYIVRDSATIVSKGDVTIKPIINPSTVSTSIHGDISKRRGSRLFEIAFTPAGVVEAGLLAKLWPHRNASPYTLIGQSIFGANDVACVIYTIDGKSITFHASAIAKMPNILVKAGETQLGEMLIRAVNRNSYEPTNVASMFTYGTQAWSAPSVDKTHIPTAPARAAWGAVAPWDSFESRDGWSIEFDLGLFDVPVDSLGVVDQRIANLSVKATATPVPTDAALGDQQILEAMDLQGTNAYVGADIATSNDLVITSLITGGLAVTLTDAAMTAGGAKFGLQTIRNEPCTWEANRDGTNALFSVAIVA